MSHLKALDKKIQDRNNEIQRIKQEYQTYSDGVVSSVKELLVQAGVYDEVHALELEREDVLKKAQARVQDLLAEIQKFNALKPVLAELEADPVTQDLPVVEAAPLSQPKSQSLCPPLHSLPPS